jgi:ABC-type spermidine/putrescine transport system permease subunit I
VSLLLWRKNRISRQTFVAPKSCTLCWVFTLCCVATLYAVNKKSAGGAFSHSKNVSKNYTQNTRANHTNNDHVLATITQSATSWTAVCAVVGFVSAIHGSICDAISSAHVQILTKIKLGAWGFNLGPAET